MPKKSRFSLLALLVSQTQVAFNDNASKLALMGLAQMALPAGQSSKVISLLAALLVLPFVLFAPLVGWLSDRFSKRDVLNFSLGLQIVAIGAISASLYYHFIFGAVSGFFLLAVQACIFSPAKQGILKELVGNERLGVAVGWMELLTIAAILLGSVFGGWSFDHFTSLTSDPWHSALITTCILGGGALLSWVIFQSVERTPSQSNLPFHVSLLWKHFPQMKSLWIQRPLRLSALGVAYFYTFGGFLYLTLVQLGRELHIGGVGAVTDTGIMLAILGGGVGIGSLIAAAYCRRTIELGLVPIGGIGLAFGPLLLSYCAPSTINFYAGLLFIGITGAVFCVPLNAFLQSKAKDSERGTVIASANLLINIGGILAVVAQFLLAQTFQFTVKQQLLSLVLPSLIIAIYVVSLLPESLLSFSILFIVRIFYRVRAKGVANIPQGGALIICNHVSYVDALILQAACPRPIRFIAHEAFHKTWWAGWALKTLGVIPISRRRAKDAIQEAVEKLKDGELVCIFPEGQLTRTGTLLKLKKGFESIARDSQTPVLPVYLDSIWGSIFSFADNKYVWKVPRKWPYPVLVNFGGSIPCEKATTEAARRSLLDLGEDSFNEREELKSHVAFSSLEALSKSSHKEFLVDRLLTRTVYSRGTVLALSLSCAGKWKNSIKGKRVGIVLPPGIGATVSNLGLLFAGKIPVNLNFTAGRAAVEASKKKAGIEVEISTESFKSKLSEFPFGETIDIADELRQVSKISIILWRIGLALLPPPVIAALIGIPQRGDREEAAVIFTSGSSGDPKGVVLSHRNILANVAQFASTGITQKTDTILGSLPLFHSFGFTVTLWYPLLTGTRLVTVPSPLDFKKIGEAIKNERITVILGTPTFIRPYLRKFDKEQLASVRIVMTGAEKLPADLAKEFKDRYDIQVLEGYGLTETSPVTSINIPNPKIVTSTGEPQDGFRELSVGRLIPGMTAKIIHHETKEELSLFEVGLLHLRGANIFSGYLLDEARTSDVLKENWFITGDLARFDEDGFLFIEGRLSRFSKIGGEMVPHGTIEEKIVAAFNLGDSDLPVVTVVGVRDSSGSESLVLLTTVDISLEALREKLSIVGLPNLWIPKKIKVVDKIPVLGTGKIDLKGCQKLAEEE